MEKKLHKLDTIETAVNHLTERLNTMESKMGDIEHSQKFVCDQYDSLAINATENKAQISSMQSEVNKLVAENNSLRQTHENLAEDLIDMKCRSMRDNMLFFGIVEGSERQLPSSLPPLEQSVQPDQTASPLSDAQRDQPQQQSDCPLSLIFAKGSLTFRTRTHLSPLTERTGLAGTIKPKQDQLLQKFPIRTPNSR